MPGTSTHINVSIDPHTLRLGAMNGEQPFSPCLGGVFFRSIYLGTVAKRLLEDTFDATGKTITSYKP